MAWTGFTPWRSDCRNDFEPVTGDAEEIRRPDGRGADRQVEISGCWIAATRPTSHQASGLGGGPRSGPHTTQGTSAGTAGRESHGFGHPQVGRPLGPLADDGETGEPLRPAGTEGESATGGFGVAEGWRHSRRGSPAALSWF